MKKNEFTNRLKIFFIIVLLGSIAFSCKKTKDNTNDTPIDPANANAVQSALKINNGKLISGNLPGASSGNAPSIDEFQSSVEVNSTGRLVIPFEYTSASGIGTVYLQVVGSTNGVLQISINTNITSGTNGIIITLPNLLLGEFTVTYCIKNNSGDISHTVTTLVNVRDAVTCDNATNNGSDGLTFTDVTMNDNSGMVSMDYDTYSIPDRIDIYQGNTWLTGTGTDPGPIPPLYDCSVANKPGFVGQSGTLTFNYNPSKGKIITVVVSGCLNSGTLWTWNFSCP